MYTADDDLSPAQWDAVRETEGFIRVIAGAGAGKTRTLTHRFAYLVREMGILPENILCVTFTNKAANEMRRRIRRLLGDNDTGYINTFHGFCVSILQEDIAALRYPKQFLVLDNSDIDAMLGVVYEERGLGMRDMTFARARDMIEEQKLFSKPGYYRDMLDLSEEKLYEKYLAAEDVRDIIFYGYLWQEKKCYGLDYNDLLILTLHLFSTCPDIAHKWQARLAYIMIDEFQDIDLIQYELMRALCGYHQNLFVVGDPDQTIYSWRGADARFLMEFDQMFPGTKTLYLLENYRTVPPVIDAANALIDKNVFRVPKSLSAVRTGGEKPVFHFAHSADEEAAWMARMIGLLHENGTAYRDIAVLYRAHYVSRSVEEALLKAKIPYRLYSGTPFFARAEVRDAIAYLRMAVMRDDLSFRRIINVPKRNIGKRRMAFLEDFAQAHGMSLYEALVENLNEPLFLSTDAGAFVRMIETHASGAVYRNVTDLLSDLLRESGYEQMLRTEGSQERLDNLAELRQSVQDFELSAGEEVTPEYYLAHVALMTSADEDDRADRVKLMTVHAAKGLEFPCVFLCGMNEGIFPSRKVRDRRGMEEERRLCFVALTRAKNALYLSAAEGRNWDGSPRYPSRFILDIGSECLTFTEALDPALLEDARVFIRESERALPETFDFLPAGTRVIHDVLGAGTVREVDEERECYLIDFDSLPTPRKISARAKLRRGEDLE